MKIIFLIKKINFYLKNLKQTHHKSSDYKVNEKQFQICLFYILILKKREIYLFKERVNVCFDRN